MNENRVFKEEGLKEEETSSHIREFWPELIYVTDEAREDPLTKRVLKRLPRDRQVVRVSTNLDPLRVEKGDHQHSEDEQFTLGKRRLLLSRHRGHWLEACPGTDHHVCCNLWTVNPGEGCPLDCTYCFLQSYLKRNPTMKIFTNTKDMLGEIESKAQQNPDRLFRIGTGEVMDSLVWDELTDLTTELVPFFARIPNLILELKSKFDFVDNLLALRNEHLGKTVVSWSVNAPQITTKDEAFTASLERRITAASRVVEAGYRVGFHFDPLILFEGWEDGYRDLVQYIFSRIDPKNVAWVSVSSLRYKPEMQQMMQKRFPNSKIPYGEQIVAKDNKVRYVQPLRMKLVNFVWKELKAVNATLPVYMCMESAAAWRYIAGNSPAAGSELQEVFSKRGKLPILVSQPA